LLPPISRRDAAGFSSGSACPCPHAVAPTPPEWVSRVSQSTTPHAAFAFTGAGSASGAAHGRGHLGVRVRYGLATRPHPEDEAVERLQKVGFPSPCSPSYRALAFPLVGFPPTEHASLRWTHTRTCSFPASGSSVALASVQEIPASKHLLVAKARREVGSSVSDPTCPGCVSFPGDVLPSRPSPCGRLSLPLSTLLDTTPQPHTAGIPVTSSAPPA